MKNPIEITASDKATSPAKLFNKTFSFPVCNIAESPDKLQIVLEVPGYKYDDLAVHIGQTRLFVSGSRGEIYNDKNRLHISTERIASFRWVYDLKTKVTRDDLQIALENGFMFITVEKRKTSMPNTIDFMDMQLLVNDTTSWPRTNVVETAESHEFSIEIPGFRNLDVSIKINEQHLAVRGKRTMSLYDKSYQYQRVEIPLQSNFLRQYDLPENANHSQVTWRVELGVLLISVPKLKTITKEEVAREAMLA